MTQTSLWQSQQYQNDFAELCNAFYERELRMLVNAESLSVETMQGRLKSLPHYIKRTAFLMIKVSSLSQFPLTLDVQNASWSAKQTNKMPLSEQSDENVFAWYLENKLSLGLVVPILVENHIVLDCIDRIDSNNKRLRTNASGWFSLYEQDKENINTKHRTRLLKPNKKIMITACAGHCWQVENNSLKLTPIIPSLRELLLSCAINWKNFKQPLPI